MGQQGARGQQEGRPAALGAAAPTDADKFDNLAKIALQRQIGSEREAKAVEPTIESQTEIVAKLKDGLNGMKQKLEQLKSKRSELLARSKTAEAQNKVHDAVKSIDVLDPTSELGRFEDKVRRQEALAAGKEELAASSLDAQFNSLEDMGELTEVEARLAELKAGGAPAQAGDRRPDGAVHAVAASQRRAGTLGSPPVRVHDLRFSRTADRFAPRHGDGCERMRIWPDS